MRRDAVSANINTIRTKAGWPGSHCPTCTRAVSTPYRQYDSHGKVVSGCVDASHVGHVYGESLRWHVGLHGREIRRQTLESLKGKSR